MSGQAWYALKVRTRSERIALVSLSYRGFETYSPEAVARRRYSDRMKTVAEPIFPGYVFCRFELSRKANVLGSNAVEYVVSFRGQPASILDSEIASVRRIIQAGGSAAPLPKSGQRVRIIGGSLEGVEGLFIREANESQFMVSVPLLQRSVSVTIDQSLVQPM
ncbi:MAG TPA: transcription termination/antitermination NusG family protein [Terriglobales bacterium]|nr:transcription termination/antitermination NusG family protein [Terriglobales bacterium]